MRNFKNYLSLVAMAALLFTSCSKEDQNVIPEENQATVSFATVLNDMVANKAALKDHLSDFPVCSDAIPDHVAIILTGPENVGSEDEPYVVNVSPNPGDYDGDGEEEYFTEEAAELQLIPGEYTLTYFVVYDADGNELWVAPMEGSDMANYVNNPLPNTFDVGAGVKKYVDVEIVCFDDRMVNEYGYLFFNIKPNEAIEFCIFGNYCDENGRHFVAEYSVSIWAWEDGEMGEVLYTDVQNNVELNENGEYAEDPLCFALPDTEGMDEYYFEITLLDSDAYGDVENEIIRSGVINDDLVRSFFDGENNLDYYHFKEGECENGDTPPIFPDPTEEADYYKACIYQLNDSYANGFAFFKLTEDELEVTVLASGLENGQAHPQHIHGFSDDSVSSCPDESAADDIEDDGLISLEEGLPSYGPVILSLVDAGGNFPTASTQMGVEGVIIYGQTFTLGEGGNPSVADLGPLENRAIVLHGMTVNGEYWATLPVACGNINWAE